MTKRMILVLLSTCALLSTSALALFVAYGFFNGSTCQYSMSLHVPDDDRDLFLTCYRGKVVALQTKQNQQGEIVSKWKVEARQLKIGQQAIYFVYSRTPLISNNQVDENDRFNQISAGYKFLFYRLIRQGEHLYVFQAFPRHFVHNAKISGRLDMWDQASP